MNQGDRYVKLVEWSEEDARFIGSCPELFYGGCHGSDPKSLFAERCEVIEDSIQVYEREGRRLPEPMSGREFVNVLQRIA